MKNLYYKFSPYVLRGKKLEKELKARDGQRIKEASPPTGGDFESLSYTLTQSINVRFPDGAVYLISEKHELEKK